MFQGKKKAITFSYDDGVTQDRRLIKLLNKYGLKGTFNLNSGRWGAARAMTIGGNTVPHVVFGEAEIGRIYEGHEIAVHTLTHPSLKNLPDSEVIREVEEDRLRLSELAGYEVVGMAYPGGTSQTDARSIELVRNHTGIRYVRPQHHIVVLFCTAAGSAEFLSHGVRLLGAGADDAVGRGISGAAAGNAAAVLYLGSRL